MASGCFQKFKDQLSLRKFNSLTEHEPFHNAVLVPYTPCTLWVTLDMGLTKINPCTPQLLGWSILYYLLWLSSASYSILIIHTLLSSHNQNDQDLRNVKTYSSALTPVLKDSGWVLHLSSRRVWFSGRKQNTGTIKMFAIVFLILLCLYSTKKSSTVMD